MKFPEIKNKLAAVLPYPAVESIEFLGEGDFCRAYLVNGELVARFARRAEARESLRRENCLLPQLLGLVGLKIPSPSFFFDADEPENAFIAYPYLDYPALTRRRYRRLGEASRTDCAAAVARFLARLHGVDTSLAERCGVPFADYAAKYSTILTCLRERLSRKLERADFAFAEREIEDYLAAGRAHSFRPVLLHGDLSPDHVLFDPAAEKATAVIDFGDLTIGDAAWDFLWIYEDYGLDFLRRSVKFYEHADRMNFLRRVYRFSVLSLVEWLVEAADDEKDFARALKRLKKIKASDTELRRMLAVDFEKIRT